MINNDSGVAMKALLKSFVSVIILTTLVFAQDSGDALQKATQLLDNYVPPEPVITEPVMSSREAWKQEYDKVLATMTTRWVDSVIAFSSEYSPGDGSWDAIQVIGTPDVYPGYGDNAAAWASANADGQREWLELHFANPEPISNVNIYETYNPGAVDTIYVRNAESGEWVEVWQGTAASAGAQTRIFSVYFDTTAFPVSDIRLAINSPVVSGYNEIDAVSVTSNPAPQLRVNTMPGYETSTQYANAVAGQPVSVWGNVHNGTAPYTYKLEFGDGVIDSGTVSDPHYIGADHVYATAGTRTMRLTIWDAADNMAYDESQIRVFAVPTDQININIAIDSGLLYLYLNQYPTGYWHDGYGYTAATGAALLAFEENGHLPTNDFDEDIYAEYVRLGIDYLLNNVTTYGISEQQAGNPDSDGDGVGAYLNTSVYANGIGLLAILGAYRSGSDAMSDIIQTGPYGGQSHYDFIVDAIDQYAFNQTDSSSGGHRGGWRYNINTPNYGSSDNSAVQWPGLVIEAAEKSWGMSVAPFVKNELLIFLKNSQDTTSGGFGYGVNYYDYWTNMAKTGSGIGSYAALDYTSSEQEIQKAIGFLDAHWNDTYDNRSYGEHLNGNLYAMYAVAKGMRITDNRVGVTNIGTRNWYNDYADHLLNHASWGQQADGRWNNSVWFNYPALNTAFAVLVLTQGVIIPPPVALIADLGSLPTNTAFQLNGSNSFHQDPEKSIIEWLWDFDASDGIDWENPDATGQSPTHPGFDQSGSYQITLRVSDNSNPPLYDLDNIFIQVDDTTNHPPIAVAIPPGNPSYAGRIGEPIFLDGSQSYDPDAPLDSVAAYNWDTNGDGIFGDATTDTVTITFDSEYHGQVGLRVYDTKGDSSSNLAYITIVASRQDLYISSLEITSTSVTKGQAFAKMNEATPVIPGDSLHITAVLINDPESNVDADQVLVRFYDEDPLTVGNRLGSDYYVSMTVGKSDTIETLIPVSEQIPLGPRNIYAYLDPKDQRFEWDERNNLQSFGITVVLIPAPVNLTATPQPSGDVELSWEDRSDNENGFILERKLQADSLFAVIDSVTADQISYTDPGLVDSTTYVYRIRAFNDFSMSNYSNEAQAEVVLVSIGKEPPQPTAFHLAQNYPNPFNPETTIRYELPERSRVKLTIFNLLGEKVFAFTPAVKDIGYHQYDWNASGLASGIYVYVLEAAPLSGQQQPFIRFRKMVLLK